MKKLLVTASGGDFGQALIKALRLSSARYELFGCDADADGIGNVFVARCRRVSRAEAPGYAAELDALCREWKVDAVLPASEAEIRVLSVSSRLPSGAAVVCQPRAWFMTHSDKLLSFRSLEGKTEMAPYADGSDRAAVSALAAKYGFPLVVKPRVSSGSRSVCVVRNSAGLERALAETPNAVVQGYLDDSGGEYSVGVYAEPSRIRLIAFCRTLLHGGGSWSAETSADEAVLAYSRRVAEVSGLSGSANIQLRKTAAGPRLLEINPRFSSLVAARAACGFHDADWSVRAALGLPADKEAGAYKTLRFRRFFHEAVDFGDGFHALADWSPRAARQKETR